MKQNQKPSAAEPRTMTPGEQMSERIPAGFETVTDRIQVGDWCYSPLTKCWLQMEHSRAGTKPTQREVVIRNPQGAGAEPARLFYDIANERGGWGLRECLGANQPWNVIAICEDFGTAQKIKGRLHDAAAAAASLAALRKAEHDLTGLLGSRALDSTQRPFFTVREIRDVLRNAIASAEGRT